VASTSILSAVWRTYNHEPDDWRSPGPHTRMSSDVLLLFAPRTPGFLKFEPQTPAYDGVYTHISHFTGGAE